MKTVKAWSYSAWDLYNTCPLKYKLEKIDRIEVPTGPALLRGREVHDNLAKYLRGDTDAPGVEIASPTARRLHEEIRAFDNKVIEQQWAFTDQWKGTGWFDKNVWVRVVLDVGVLYDDMTAEVIDHKTGKNSGSYGDQMEIFSLAVFQRQAPVTHVTTRLSFVDYDSEVFAEHDRSELPGLVDKWREKVRPMFEDTEFLPRPNDKCRFCHFRRSNGGVCRYG